MWNLKINDTNDLYLLKRKRLTDLENELTVAGGSTGEGVVGEFGMDIYTPLCLKWITNRVCIAYGALLNVKGNLDGKRVWGKIDTCTCMAESLRCSHNNITTLLISYTPIQNKKFFKKVMCC